VRTFRLCRGPVKAQRVGENAASAADPGPLQLCRRGSRQERPSQRPGKDHRLGPRDAIAAKPLCKYIEFRAPTSRRPRRASRAAVGCRLRAERLQVGQTRKVVAPNCTSLSAAPGDQHRRHEDSQVIVAINKEEDARSSSCDYGRSRTSTGGSRADPRNSAISARDQQGPGRKIDSVRCLFDRLFQRSGIPTSRRNAPKVMTEASISLINQYSDSR